MPVGPMPLTLTARCATWATMTPKYPAGPARMKSRVMKRSPLVDGRKTSVPLEDEFWTSLKEIATT